MELCLSLKLTVKTRLASESQRFTCLCLLSSGIKGVGHYAWLPSWFPWGCSDDLLQLTSFGQSVFIYFFSTVSLTIFETGSQSVCPGTHRDHSASAPLSARIKDMCHPSWPLSYFLSVSGRVKGSPPELLSSTEQKTAASLLDVLFFWSVSGLGRRREDSTP